MSEPAADEDRNRVGRTIMDAALLGSEVQEIADAIDKHTQFTTERRTGMRIDVYQEAGTNE